ncbi:MAG: type IV secretion system DNA-binding domain-containing protein [Pelatocladus maniniholoensis HA4357-MV3]|jgi:type IV secretory pathway TraG/TraD family ATPase VirD4|uniref:Type IV secretion system DNA-binding domain-containing protein n=1 Tax=Pelatocladus maniniholoensis HA4357-MV3 TaxID=1117104 RepID=A0A9E3LVU8_9NOST|nr:type IV secretion system DNA-binding domain-containing protein [Pelatocladus maniniholoensis HA4357-MV3]
MNYRFLLTSDITQPPNQTVLEQLPKNDFQSGIDFNGLLKTFANPEGLAMVGGLIFLILLSQFTSGKKGKISTGRLVGKVEKLAATNLALKQIQERKHNKVCFWCGSPRYWFSGKLRGFGARLQTFLGASPTVWIPHAERSTLVLGAPGSGKTFGTIDRMAQSCMAQGFPLIVYDKKGDQMKLLAPLAARYGYDVRIFAPGEPYSEVINPLDFMENQEDAVTAAQIAQVINANAGSGKSDEFFSKAADLLAKALIQLAKGSDCPDLATVYCIQSVDDFINKLYAAVQAGKVSRWVAASFQQYLKARDSEKTIASIDTTTVGIFSAFIQRSLLPCFIGKSTIPTKLSGRQILIFKLDDPRRDVVGPLLAAALHMTIVSNLCTPRFDPIGIFIDELPSLYLKALPQWINEYRSNGACFVLGVQSLEQLANAYGENLAAAITSACSTKILYNPANYSTAEKFSQSYGNKEFIIKNKSISDSKEGRTTTWADNIQTMPILTADEIMRFPQGKCVITNPGYTSSSEGSIPYPLTIPIPKSDQKQIEESEKLWSQQLCPRLIARSPQIDLNQLDEAIDLRKQIAEQLLATGQFSKTSPNQSESEEIELSSPASSDSPW